MVYGKRKKSSGTDRKRKAELRAARKAEKKRKRIQQRRKRVSLHCSRKRLREKGYSAWREKHGKDLRRIKLVSYHLLSVLVIGGILLLGCLRSPGSFLRLWEALRDFFVGTFGTPTVTQLPKDMVEGFPRAIEELGEIFGRIWSLLITKENFFAYLDFLWDIVLKLCYILLYALFPLILLIVYYVILYRRQKKRYGAKSLPLKAFLYVRQKVILPARKYLRGFLKFFLRRKKYFRTSVLLVLFFLNVYTIVFEFFAYYFFLLFSEELTLGLGVQVLKLVYDLFLAFRFLPVWIWLFIALWCFDRIRKRIGYLRLEKYEKDLRKFLEDRGVNILICGPPRTGKTTTLVSIVKSLMAMSRQNAKAGMREIEHKFPDFPWIVFEKMIRKDYSRRRFRNLYHLNAWTVEMIENGRYGGKEWIRRLRKQYRSCSATQFNFSFFNYDREHFKTVHKSALGTETIDDLLRDYAALYFIYIQPMLIIANFSIRSDDDWMDLGNFPEWRDDFFRHDPDKFSKSKFSKILNQDLIRPGKQVDLKCKYKDCYEFGILAETEVGKERGNQYTHSGKSAVSDEANVLNDQRDNLFKLMGHLGTIYNIHFALYVGDEQREGNWGANGKDLCDIVTIRERYKDKILMPCFAFEELLYLITKKLFGKYFDEIRYYRGDTSLLTYFLMHFCNLIFYHYEYVRDKFGGHFTRVNVVNAMKQEGDDKDLTKTKLFTANAKVYANVFRSAAWKRFLEERVANCGYGLEDIPSFRSLDPTLEEYLEMRSYFFLELLKSFSGRDQERALDLIIGNLTQLYKTGKEQFDRQTAQGLLGEFTESLPEIVKEDNVAEIKRKLEKTREVLLGKAKKKWDEEQKEKSREAEKGKKEAKKTSAATG